MIISVTIPDALVPRMRRAINGTYPGVDPDNTLTAKQVATQVTAEFWRKVLVDYEHETAEAELIETRRSAVRALEDLVNSDRAQTVTDATTIV